MKHPGRLIAFCLLVAPLACAPMGGSPSGRRSDEGGNESQRAFHLYAVEIDREAVKNGAPLLFDSPPPGVEFGLERRAQGIFQVATSGFCECTIRVAEPVIGLGGRRTEHRYTLLDFTGKMGPEGRNATLTGGENLEVATSYRPTEIRFEERGDDKLTIQAVVKGKPAAYRFHFQLQGFSATNVPFPWH